MRKFGPIRMRIILVLSLKKQKRKGLLIIYLVKEKKGSFDNLPGKRKERSFDNLPGKGKPLNLDKDLSYNPENNCIEL